MAHTGTLYIQEEVAIYSPTINVMCGIYGTGKIFVYTYASFHCPGVLKIGSGMCQHVFNQSKSFFSFLRDISPHSRNSGDLTFEDPGH